MAFDTNTITAKGAELLAAATAADKLILVGCDATTTYLTENQAVVIALRPSTPASNTTSVSMVGATGDHVMARAEFDAGVNTGGDVNTLYLYGHKQSAPNDDYVVYICSSQTAFHLPEVGDVISAYEALFDMIYAANNDSVETASTSVFTTLAEFNLLKERVVTTHKEGLIGVGDNQNIYGDKYFYGYLRCMDTGSFKIAEVSQNLTVKGNILAYDFSDDPDEHPGDIGASNNPFSNLYVEDVHCGLISATDNIITTQSVETGGGLHCGTEAYFNSDIYITGGIELSANVEPDTSNSGEVGTYAYPFQYCYAGGLMMYSGMIGLPVSEGNTPAQRITFGTSPNSISVIASNASINTSTTGTTTGCSFNVTFAAVKQLEITYNAGDSQYETTISTPLSVSGLLTCNGLTGNQPSYSSSTRNIKVGSIFMAMFDTGVSALYTGEEYHSDSTDPLTYTLKFAKVKGTYSGGIGGFEVDNTNDSVPDGKYVLLSDVDPTTNEAWAFVQCVSLD